MRSYRTSTAFDRSRLRSVEALPSFACRIKSDVMHQSTKHATALPGVEVISIISDRSFPLHTHDEFGIGYIVRGGQESWSGRGMVEASAGDVITLNPGELHDGLGRKGTPRHWRMLFFAPEIIRRFAASSRQGLEFTSPVVQDRVKSRAVARAIDALSTEERDDGYLEELLISALQDVAAEPAHTHRRDEGGYSRAVRRVLDEIGCEAAAPLRLDDFAEAAGMSRFQILRLFAREVGTPPYSYLMQHRVKTARRLIRSGMALAEAAVAAGFSDQSHMTRAFVKQFGITPGACKAERPK